MGDFSTVKNVMDFLGEENLDKIRETMTDALIDNLTESIDKNWIVLPDTFQEMWNEVAEEVMKKYRKKLKDAMCEQVEQMIARMKPDDDNA